MVDKKIPINEIGLTNKIDSNSKQFTSFKVRLSALAMVLLMSGIISVMSLFLTSVVPASAEISIPSGMDIMYYDPITNGSNWKNPQKSWTFGPMNGWGNGSIAYIDSVQVTSKYPQTITTNLTTPIDLSNYKKVILQFDTNAVSTKRGNQKESVIVTDEKGIPHIVWIKSKATFSGTQSIDISNIVAGNKSINITFQYVKKGGPVKNSLWEVDDVLVLGNKTGEVSLNTFEFNSSIYDVREDSDYVTINVTRTNSQNAASVDFYTEDGTALAGTNYGILNDINGVSGTIYFAAGQQYNNTVQVPILHDPSYNTGLYFLVGLENPSDNSYLGSPVEVDITDIDSVPSVPVVEFKEPLYEVNENDDSALIMLTSDKASSVSFSVTYTASNDTALAGINYGDLGESVVTGKATFGAGETTTTFTVPIHDDGVYSHGIDFTIKLSSLPADAVIGTQDSTTVNIIEWDPKPTITAMVPAIIDEGNQALITFNKAGYTMLPASFDVTVLDSAGLATANLSKVTFGPSDITTDLLLTVPGDGIYDPARTVTVSFKNEMDCTAPDQQFIAVNNKDVVPYTISLKQGWNLISEPVILDSSKGNNSIDTVFAPIMSNVIVIWAYDPDLGWQYYIPGGSYTFSTINEKMSIWVSMSSDASTTIYGMVPSNEQISLNPGWNLIGYPSLTDNNAQLAFNSINGQFTVVWTFDSVEDWQWYIPGGTSNNLIDVKTGHGYWIQMNDYANYEVV